MIFALHVFSCLFMTGAIWLVQVLVYPNFRLVDKSQFETFHLFHTNRITWVVAPVMTIELATGAWLLIQSQSAWLILNFASVLLTWALTAMVNVPAHKKLNFENHLSKQQLVRLNWPRTLVWSLRSLFFIFFILANAKEVTL